MAPSTVSFSANPSPHSYTIYVDLTPSKSYMKSYKKGRSRGSGSSGSKSKADKPPQGQPDPILLTPPAVLTSLLTLSKLHPSLPPHRILGARLAPTTSPSPSRVRVLRSDGVSFDAHPVDTHESARHLLLHHVGSIQNPPPPNAEEAAARTLSLAHNQVATGLGLEGKNPYDDAVDSAEGHGGFLLATALIGRAGISMGHCRNYVKMYEEEVVDLAPRIEEFNNYTVRTLLDLPYARDLNARMIIQEVTELWGPVRRCAFLLGMSKSAAAAAVRDGLRAAEIEPSMTEGIKLAGEGMEALEMGGFEEDVVIEGGDAEDDESVVRGIDNIAYDW